MVLTQMDHPACSPCLTVSMSSTSVPAQLKATSAQHKDEHCMDIQVIAGNAIHCSAGFCHCSAIDYLAVSLIFIQKIANINKCEQLRSDRDTDLADMACEDSK